MTHSMLRTSATSALLAPASFAPSMCPSSADSARPTLWRQRSGLSFSHQVHHRRTPCRQRRRISDAGRTGVRQSSCWGRSKSNRYMDRLPPLSSTEPMILAHRIRSGNDVLQTEGYERVGGKWTRSPEITAAGRSVYGISGAAPVWSRAVRRPFASRSADPCPQ